MPPFQVPADPTGIWQSTYCMLLSTRGKPQAPASPLELKLAGSGFLGGFSFLLRLLHGPKEEPSAFMCLEVYKIYRRPLPLEQGSPSHLLYLAGKMLQSHRLPPPCLCGLISLLAQARAERQAALARSAVTVCWLTIAELVRARLL